MALIDFHHVVYTSLDVGYALMLWFSLLRTLNNMIIKCKKIMKNFC